MSRSSLSPKQWIFLAALTIATLVLWKLGAPESTPPTLGGPEPSVEPKGYKLKEEKACCEKPPSRAALMLKASTSPVKTDPAPAQ
ncbi:MAG: hypothetical protein RLZZ399_1481 [Verrucomicrobiota bacterium]